MAPLAATRQLALAHAHKLAVSRQSSTSFKKTEHSCTHAQGKRNPGPMAPDADSYDTLEALKLGANTSLYELYGMVCGSALAQSDICGTVTSGPWDQTHSATPGWGEAFKFDNYDEIWQVRSAP